MRACVDGRETDDDIEVTTEGIFWKEFAINMESLNNQIHNLSMETGGIPNGLNTNFNFPLDLYKSERKRLVQNLPKLRPSLGLHIDMLRVDEVCYHRIGRGIPARRKRLCNAFAPQGTDAHGQ